MWVLVGRTESGDDFVYLWDNMPTEGQIAAVLLRDMPEEVEAGTCDSYRVERVYVED